MGSPVSWYRGEYESPRSLGANRPNRPERCRTGCCIATARVKRVSRRKTVRTLRKCAIMGHHKSIIVGREAEYLLRMHDPLADKTDNQPPASARCVAHHHRTKMIVI